MDVAGYVYIYNIRIWACFCRTRWKLSFCFLSGKPSRWTRQLVDEMRCIEHDLMAIQAQQQQQHQPIAFWFGSGFLRSLTRYRQSQGEKLEYPLTFLNIAHRYIGLPVSLTNLRTSPIETCCNIIHDQIAFRPGLTILVQHAKQSPWRRVGFHRHWLEDTLNRYECEQILCD